MIARMGSAYSLKWIATTITIAPRMLAPAEIAITHRSRTVTTFVQTSTATTTMPARMTLAQKESARIPRSPAMTTTLAPQTLVMPVQDAPTLLLPATTITPAPQMLV